MFILAGCLKIEREGDGPALHLQLLVKDFILEQQQHYQYNNNLIAINNNNNNNFIHFIIIQF